MHPFIERVFKPSKHLQLNIQIEIFVYVYKTNHEIKTISKKIHALIPLQLFYEIFVFGLELCHMVVPLFCIQNQK